MLYKSLTYLLTDVYCISVAVSASAEYPRTKQTSEVCMAGHLARCWRGRSRTERQNDVILTATILHIAAERHLQQVAGIWTWG